MKLVKNVKVGDTWYGPAWGNAENVPTDVAAQITNPKAWDEQPAPEAAGDGGQGEGDNDVADVEALTAEYRELTRDDDYPDGRDPDKRWRPDTLRSKVEALRDEA